MSGVSGIQPPISWGKPVGRPASPDGKKPTPLPAGDPGAEPRTSYGMPLIQAQTAQKPLCAAPPGRGSAARLAFSACKAAANAETAFPGNLGPGNLRSDRLSGQTQPTRLRLMRGVLAHLGLGCGCCRTTAQKRYRHPPVQRSHPHSVGQS